jgi:predicted small integral membrane protein
MIAWMHWTWMSVLGFALLAALLGSLALLDQHYPGYGRKGLLPIETTRGDRVFMSIAGFITLVFAWLKYFPEAGPLWVFAVTAVLAFIIMKWF